MNSQSDNQSNRILADSNIRFWKCNYQYNTREKIAEFLKEHNIGGVSTHFTETQNPDQDIEENTGVSFPG